MRDAEALRLLEERDELRIGSTKDEREELALDALGLGAGGAATPGASALAPLEEAEVLA